MEGSSIENNSNLMDALEEERIENNENSMEEGGGTIENVPYTEQTNNFNSQIKNKINLFLKPIDNNVLLKDNLFCFHPLLPIYVNLTSFYNQIGPDFNEDPFYDSYIKYVNVLEKMTFVLIDQYLIDNLKANLNAYFIGFSLKTIFFHANKSISLFNTLKKLLNLDDNETRMFSMKNYI
jgi:hypothetical protein